MALRYALSVSLWPASRAAMSCSVAFSVMALICSDFISVLLCGDLVPSPEAGEPKDRVCRRTEGGPFADGADGNRRDTSPASGATGCKRRRNQRRFGRERFVRHTRSVKFGLLADFFMER